MLTKHFMYLCHVLQAVNKLEEILKRKDIQPGQKKATAAQVRQKEKEIKKLQAELTRERNNFSKMQQEKNKESSETSAVSTYALTKIKSIIKLLLSLYTKNIPGRDQWMISPHRVNCYCVIRNSML